MTTKSIQGSNLGPVVTIGSGLCAAVLFTLLRQGTPQALALAHLAPLPIMISAMGFGPLIGFGSAAVATLSVALLAVIHEGVVSSAALIIGLAMAAMFIVFQALPAWWLGFLACLGRLDETSRWRVQPGDKKMSSLSFYPIGRILVHAAGIAIGLTSIITGISALHYGSFGAAVEHLTAKVLPVVGKLVESRPELFTDFDVHAITSLVVKTTPAVMAVWCLLTFIANLWLAGRVVQTSNRLRRPWPNIAQELSLPRPLVLALAAAFGLCFVKDWPSTIGLVATATLLLIYALQGMAVVHSLSRGSRWRAFILFAIYATLVLFIPWPLAIFALLGLADTAFSLRERKAAALLASKP
jgi:hypothetical protein